MEVSGCYSKSWKSPKQFNYQQQQLSVACVWPTWCNHSLQRRLMLPMSLWMAAISRVIHYKHGMILSTFRVVYTSVCIGKLPPTTHAKQYYYIVWHLRFVSKGIGCYTAHVVASGVSAHVYSTHLGTPLPSRWIHFPEILCADQHL